MQSPCDTEWITTSFVVTGNGNVLGSEALPLRPPVLCLHSVHCSTQKKCLKVLVQALPVSDIYLSEKQNYILRVLYYCVYQRDINRWKAAFKRRTIQSQTIRKLKPMKSPSTPPQSATKDWKENASTSLWTITESLAKDCSNTVMPVGVMMGSPTACWK